MPRHTPTPWKVQLVEEKHHGYDGWNTFAVRDEKTNGCIAMVGEVDRQFDTVNEANAEFIVTACNSHDELIAELKLALRYLEHPDVQAIPFAMRASTVTDRIHRTLAKLEEDLSEENSVAKANGK